MAGRDAVTLMAQAIGLPGKDKNSPLNRRRTLADIRNGVIPIKGTVSSLKVGWCYENPLFSDWERGATGALTYGAAAQVAGLSSAATISLISNAEIQMECYSCVVNRARITGAFSKVGFQNGDEVEFVCREADGGFIAVAARAEAQRLIWMRPYQIKGELLYKKKSLKWCWVGALSATAATSILVLLFLWSVSDKNPAVGVAIGATVVFSMTMGLSLSMRNAFKPFSRDVTRVLSALGFPSPEWIDLSDMDRLAQQRILKETGVKAPATAPWVYRF